MIDTLVDIGLPTKICCRVLGVSGPGYYRYHDINNRNKFWQINTPKIDLVILLTWSQTSNATDMRIEYPYGNTKEISPADGF